jgi:hypothetical protein
MLDVPIYDLISILAFIIDENITGAILFHYKRPVFNADIRKKIVFKKINSH